MTACRVAAVVARQAHIRANCCRAAYTNVFADDPVICEPAPSSSYINAYQQVISQAARLAGLSRSAMYHVTRSSSMVYNELAEGGTCCSSIKQMHNLLTHFYKYADLNGIGRNITTSVSVPDKGGAAAADHGDELVTWSDDELNAIP